MICVFDYVSVDNPEIAIRKKKYARAYGGCLGLWRLRRTCKAAKSSGDLPKRIDPEISEWGNLSG